MGMVINSPADEAGAEFDLIYFAANQRGNWAQKADHKLSNDYGNFDRVEIYPARERCDELRGMRLFSGPRCTLHILAATSGGIHDAGSALSLTILGRLGVKLTDEIVDLVRKSNHATFTRNEDGVWTHQQGSYVSRRKSTGRTSSPLLG